METVRTHQMVVDAIRDHDEERARKAMIEHLTLNKEEIEKKYGKKEII